MEYQQYLDEKIHQLRIVCQSQWDYLKYSDLSNWLEDNFADDIEGKYYATKIILHTVYYKKKDIERLIEYGLNEKIYGEILKKELIQKGNIYIANSEALGKISELKESTFFVPLLDSDKPYESGNGIIADLVHKQYFSTKQVDYHFKVDEEKLKGYKILIFVDDCIGSGSQLKKFWNSEPIQKIREICDAQGIRIYYLVLVGYNKNLEILKKENKLSGIEIVVCDLLTDKNRIFSDENIIWDKETNEREKAIEYFDKIKRLKGVSFLGFKKLDFAVILHDRLPNWSLPILWKDTVSWKSLLRRKTSLE
jgi:hypothetical protein